MQFLGVKRYLALLKCKILERFHGQFPGKGKTYKNPKIEGLSPFSWKQDFFENQTTSLLYPYGTLTSLMNKT